MTRGRVLYLALELFAQPLTDYREFGHFTSSSIANCPDDGWLISITHRPKPIDRLVRAKSDKDLIPQTLWQIVKSAC